MFPNTLNLIIYLLVLPFLSYSRSAPMSLSYNNKYIYTSTLTIPTSQTYNSSVAAPPQPGFLRPLPRHLLECLDRIGGDQHKRHPDGFPQQPSRVLLGLATMEHLLHPRNNQLDVQQLPDPGNALPDPDRPVLRH